MTDIIVFDWEKYRENLTLKNTKLHDQKKKLTSFSISKGDLSQVSVVVSLHFQIKYFWLSIAGFGDQKFV